MSMENFKRLVVNHKQELIAATAVASGVVLVILGCKRHGKKTTKVNGIFRTKDISIPDGLKVWDTSLLWVEGGCLNAIVNSIPVDDLGELGNSCVSISREKREMIPMAQKRIKMVRTDILNCKARLLYDDGSQGELDMTKAKASMMSFLWR